MIVFVCLTLGRAILTLHLERGCWPRAYRVRSEAYGVGFSVSVLTDVPRASGRAAA